MATLALEKLSRSHAGASKPALESLSLEVGDGELLVLVGPSGCGKSTALRLIAGLDSPNSGRVLMDGRDVTNVAPQDRDVAMVFQGYALYPHLSAFDNIAFPLRMRGVAKGERKARVGEVAEMLGIAKLLDRKPLELSGGERQRVAMARAIVRRPRIFLFDEPLANLDAALRAELRVELSAMVRRLKTTAIYVTHDQAEAMTMGDRICVMNDGKLQQVAAPRVIYEAPSNVFVAGFLGSPKMNLVELSADRDRSIFVRGGVSVAAPKGQKLPEKVVIGFRPEHLGVASGAAGDELISAQMGARKKDDSSGAAYRGASLDRAVTFRAEVLGAEPLGAETHVRLLVGETLLWARVPGFDAPAAGTNVDVSVELRRVFWFDAGSGERIALGGEGTP